MVKALHFICLILIIAAVNIHASSTDCPIKKCPEGTRVCVPDPPENRKIFKCLGSNGMYHGIYRGIYSKF